MRNHHSNSTPLFFKEKKMDVNMLVTFLKNPTSWFSVGAVVISLTYVMLYDIIWTWIVPNAASDWWFKRAQAWIKIGVYLAMFGLLAIFAFVPWPWNIFIVAALILATVMIVSWLKKNHHI